MYKVISTRSAWPGIFVLLALFSTAFGTLRQDSGVRTFDIRHFGAVGDGASLDHTAINKAIEAAVAAGGGTVVVPAGKYLCGSIRLKSNIRLHLESGAIIVAAPQESNAYDETEEFQPPAYQDGGHTYFRNSLIWGENLNNVSITGQGMIDGLGDWDKGPGLWAWNPVLDRMGGCASEGSVPAPKLDAHGKPLPNSGLPPVRRGNKAIALKLCKNVLIRDVTIYRGGHFAILVTGCDDMTIDNVTIDTNRDGIDIDCCRNVMVSNCRVNSPKDDAIVPKSSYALGEPRLTENLTIKNCQVSGFEVGSFLDGSLRSGPKNWGVGRIKFGTESSGGFRNITVSDCVFRNCMGLALQVVDGGIMENVTVNNITMTDVKKYGIHITTGKRNRTPNLTTKSRMRNIRISNVSIQPVDRLAGIIITGMPEQPIEAIRIENVRLTSQGGGTREQASKKVPEATTPYPKPDWAGTLPAYGVFARHIKGLELSNITLDFLAEDLRPAARFENICGLELDGFKAKVSGGINVAEFAPDVHEIRVTNSPEIRVPTAQAK